MQLSSTVLFKIVVDFNARTELYNKTENHNLAEPVRMLSVKHIFHRT